MSQAHPHLTRGVFFTTLAGIAWGFSGCCGQLLSQNYGMPVEWVAGQRMMWAALIYALLLLGMRKKSALGMLKKPKTVAQLLTYGTLGIVFCSWFYLGAIARTNAGTGTLMEQLALIIVVGYTCFHERRRPERLEIVGLVLALVGVFFVCTHGDPRNLVFGTDGLVWGLLAMLGAVFYILLPAPLVKEYDSFSVTALAVIVAGLVTVPLFHVWTYDLNITPQIVLALAGMTVFGTIVAYLCFAQGVRDAGPVLAGLLNTVELVASYAISCIWLGTPLSGWDVLGCGCIMVMMVMITLSDAKRAGESIV